jgi:putative salt-induced outer membrane protein
MTFPSAAAGALLPLLITLPLSAQEAVKRPWALQTDFGFVNTAGNTSTTTLNVGEAASYTAGRWTFAQALVAVYGRTDGSKSAENYKATVRGDYALAPRVGAYVLGGWHRNRFAGISRRLEEGGGFSFKAVAQDRTTLTIEAGGSANQQRDLSGAQTDFAAGRGGILFKQMLGEAAYFQQSGELLQNLREGTDTRINSDSELVAPLSSHIALKAGYVVQFDNQPQPGFKKTDRFFTSGLQIVF